MKEPIKREDIRKGDHIRAEWSGLAGPRASEYVAPAAGHGQGLEHIKGSNFYLLDRPKPKVEVPATPRLGWATTHLTKRRLGFFGRHSEISELPADRVHYDFGGWNAASSVHTFEEAVAVPKAALDELREYLNGVAPSGMTDRQGWVALGDQVDTFLSAVDEANE